MTSRGEVAHRNPPGPSETPRNPLVRRRWDVIALLLILVAVFRIAATFTVFSATADEPMHVSAGLELLSQRKYGYQLNNPPLPRVVMAFPAWRAGVEFDPSRSLSDQILGVFHSGRTYERNLVRVRAPNLLFFLIAALATWWWARRELKPLGAVLATLVFTTQPMILGHFGLATHDGASVAGVAVSLMAFSRWLDGPTARRAAAFGAAFGFAICCKYSNLPFVPAACLALFLVRYTFSWRKGTPASPEDSAGQAGLPVLQHCLIAALAASLVVWAGFGFVVAVPSAYPSGDTAPARLLAWLDRTDTPVPAPHFFAGLATIVETDRGGHLSYLLGERRLRGWWWYFPLAIALKTTLASLILFIAGFAATRRSENTRSSPYRRAFLSSVAAALAMLAIAMTGHLDVGVRYVLPFYVTMSVAVAATLMALIENRRRWMSIAAAVFLTWHLGASLAAHPDYFPYFNELAGSDPSRILIDSNLDWGQDVLRLRQVLREERVERIGLSVMGPHDFDALGFPPHYSANPWLQTHGYTAISDHSFRMTQAEGGWGWLARRPYRRIGTSIRLYEIR